MSDRIRDIKDLRQVAELLVVYWSRDASDILSEAEKTARYTILFQKDDPEKLADARALRTACRNARAALRSGNANATARWAFVAGQRNLVLANRDLADYAETARKLKDRKNKGGRPPKLDEEERARLIARFDELTETSDRKQQRIIQDLMNEFNVSRSTIRRYCIDQR